MALPDETPPPPIVSLEPVTKHICATCEEECDTTSRFCPSCGAMILSHKARAITKSSEGVFTANMPHFEPSANPSGANSGRVAPATAPTRSLEAAADPATHTHATTAPNAQILLDEFAAMHTSFGFDAQQLNTIELVRRARSQAAPAEDSAAFRHRAAITDAKRMKKRRDGGVVHATAWKSAGKSKATQAKYTCPRALKIEGHTNTTNAHTSAPIRLRARQRQDRKEAESQVPSGGEVSVNHPPLAAAAVSEPHDDEVFVPKGGVAVDGLVFVSRSVQYLTPQQQGVEQQLTNGPDGDDPTDLSTRVSEVTYPTLDAASPQRAQQMYTYATIHPLANLGSGGADSAAGSHQTVHICTRAVDIPIALRAPPGEGGSDAHSQPYTELSEATTHNTVTLATILSLEVGGEQPADWGVHIEAYYMCEAVGDFPPLLLGDFRLSAAEAMALLCNNTHATASTHTGWVEPKMVS